MNSLFRNTSFLFMWIGSAVSEIGGAFGTFCNSILIYELTGSKMALGSMWLLYFIPSLLVQLGVGPYIDKWSRKWIMIFSQVARGSVFLVLLMTAFMGTLEAWHIYGVQMVVGLIQPFYAPASFAITPTIIPKEQLNAANSYIDGTTRLMSFLAPTTGGIVIEYVGVPATLSLVCLCFLLSGSLLVWIRENRTTRTIRTSWLQQFKQGISYFVSQPILVWLGFFLAIVQFGVGVTMVINLPYIIEELNESYAAYGYFMAGFPLGYVIGSILTSRIHIPRWDRRVVMLGSLMIGGMTFLALAFNPWLELAIFTEIVAGMAMPFFNINSTTLYQQRVPNEWVGQVFSVRLFIIRSAMPLGVLAGGFLSESWGVRPLYLFIGGTICVIALAGMLLPFFRFLNGEEMSG